MQNQWRMTTLCALLVFTLTVMVARAQEASTVPEQATEQVTKQATASSTPSAPPASSEAPTSATSEVVPSGLTDQLLQEKIKDRRYMMFQIRCALGEGPCDNVGRKIKALAPLVMKNICVQCTPVEKRQIQMVASHIQRNFPREWSKMLRQYGST